MWISDELKPESSGAASLPTESEEIVDTPPTEELRRSSVSNRRRPCGNRRRVGRRPSTAVTTEEVSSCSNNTTTPNCCEETDTNTLQRCSNETATECVSEPLRERFLPRGQPFVSKYGDFKPDLDGVDNESRIQLLTDALKRIREAWLIEKKGLAELERRWRRQLKKRAKRVPHLSVMQQQSDSVNNCLNIFPPSDTSRLEYDSSVMTESVLYSTENAV